jgi:galactose mutarotase-like enzyme
LYFIEDAGIKMTVSTDMPAMQLYTGDELRL